MTDTKHSPAQITAMRLRWGIPDNFVPVATAPGVIAWGTVKSAKAGA